MSFPYVATSVVTAFCLTPVFGPAISDWVKARRQAAETDAAEQEQWLDKVAGASTPDDELDHHYRTAAQARADFQRSVADGHVKLPDFTERGHARRQP